MEVCNLGNGFYLMRDITRVYRRRLPLLSPVWVTTSRLSSPSSHEGKFLNEHANIALIGTTLAHTNTRSCRHCVFAGGEEARYCTVE